MSNLNFIFPTASTLTETKTTSEFKPLIFVLYTLNHNAIPDIGSTTKPSKAGIDKPVGPLNMLVATALATKQPIHKAIGCHQTVLNPKYIKNKIPFARTPTTNSKENNDKTELSLQSRRSNNDRLYAGDNIARRINSVRKFPKIS